jgi:signal transduction histidine kinase/ActR/RegA family two-component response regulator
MFFGHSQVGVFTQEHENLAAGIAGWTAVAIENARLYTAAEKARGSAEAANRAKDEFLATMSHELRTPLNAILGWTMILRTSGNKKETRQRAIDIIERNARAQAQIIEDLLDVSRIVTGKLRLETTAVDLIAVIDSSLDSIRLASDTKRIQVRRRVDKSASVVSGDAARLQQVVTNLLTNAVKFTPDSGLIEVRLERVDGKARITVEDNGQGISAEFLPYVFERFRQADSSPTRSHGGIGLGLAIVRHLIELHGGTVRADSAGPGRGSTFIVEIPLVQAFVRSQEHELAERELRGQLRRLRGVRVLVVEDEVDSRDFITFLLQQVGATVTATSSGAEALELIDALAPDVLVTDIGMPQQDGYQLVQALRNRESPSSRTPAVAVTAYARPEDRERALSAGFQAHVSKPIAPRDLVVSIEKAVGAPRA